MTAQTQPGERVYRTRKGAELLLRPCRGLVEFEACVDLQRVIWGYPDLEISPRKAFLLAQQLGGQVMGAYDGQARLVGFVMAMAALEAAGPGEPPRPYLHSNMLAVLPEYRDQGLGTRLKLMQREDALSRGILRMTWTFDPLAAKNAYLNLHRLGAIARRYSPDFYGVSSSRLQGGLPTDRLHAEWWLQSPRVQACVGAITGQQQEPLQQPVQAVAVPDPHPQRESMPVEDASVQQTIVLTPRVGAVEAGRSGLRQGQSDPGWQQDTLSQCICKRAGGHRLSDGCFGQWRLRTCVAPLRTRHHTQSPPLRAAYED